MPNTDIDTRLKRELDQGQLKYRIVDGCDFQVFQRQLDNEREQRVTLRSATRVVSERELRSMEAFAYYGEGPQPKILAHCLEQNAGLAHGSWRMRLDNENRLLMLLFGMDVDAEAGVRELKDMIRYVATTADRLEQTITDDDVL